MSKDEKRLRAVLSELADCVGGHVLNALSTEEIKDSYSELARAYNKALRLLNKTTKNK